MPDLTTSCRLDEFVLVAVSQDLTRGQAVIECRVVDTDPWCRGCGVEGVTRDSVARQLAYLPFGHRSTTLSVRIRRYRCPHCFLVWRRENRLKFFAVPMRVPSPVGMPW